MFHNGMSFLLACIIISIFGKCVSMMRHYKYKYEYEIIRGHAIQWYKIPDNRELANNIKSKIKLTHNIAIFFYYVTIGLSLLWLVSYVLSKFIFM